MNELTITKEAVLRAASKCSQAKDVLKEMFPEAFKAGPIDLARMIVGVTSEGHFISKDAWPNKEWMIRVRTSGEFACRAFLLNHDRFSWSLEKDSEGRLCLVPKPL